MNAAQGPLDFVIFVYTDYVNLHTLTKFAHTDYINNSWLWTLFLSGPSWVTGWVTACLFPCYVAYYLWSNFYFIILALQLSIPRGSEYFQRVVRERKFCMWHTHTTIKKYFISSYMWCSFVILDDRLCYIILRRFAFLTYWSYWFSCVPSTRANKGPTIVVDIYVFCPTINPKSKLVNLTAFWLTLHLNFDLWLGIRFLYCLFVE